MKACVIVPWRDKGTAYSVTRRANLSAVLEHLTAAHLGDVMIVDDGRDKDAPFCRSAAYNRGVAMRNDPDMIYMFHEADMIVPVEQLETAIKIAAHPDVGLVVPFTQYRYLSSENSAAVRGGAVPDGFTAMRKMVDGSAVGAVNVVSAKTMAKVGQWDETFQGWGYDDRAQARAFYVVTSCATEFVTGDAWHLWHEPGWAAGGRFAGGSHDVSEREQQATEANRQRMQLYMRASTPQRIRELTSGAL